MLLRMPLRLMLQPLRVTLLAYYHFRTEYQRALTPRYSAGVDFIITRTSTATQPLPRSKTMSGLISI